jgi:hypothetical protein
MTKQIIFESSYPWFEKVALKPTPAFQMIPEWFKNMSPYTPTPENPEAKHSSVFNGTANHSAKKCTPMLDALTSGYIIPLWTDVYVDASDKYETPAISWKVSRDVFEQHGTQAQEVGTPTGFHSQPYKYLNYWRVITPPGYSIMVTQPHGFKDTNLQAVSAVIDSDKSSLQILPPLWIKKGFVGVIEKGTPIIQITPFKRENWQASYTCLKDDEEYRNIEDANFQGTIINHYIKKIWSRKSYK